MIFHDLGESIVRDARGWVANPLLLQNFPKDYGHLHVVSMNPGAVRGNHYHKIYREWLFVFGGEYEFCWVSDGNIKRRSISKDEVYTIEIPPGVPHVIKNTGENIIYLTAYQDGDKTSIMSDTLPSPIPEL